MILWDRARAIAPSRITDFFAAGNLGFLGVDIYIAHKANGFAHALEWLPVFFSALAPVLLVPLLIRPSARPAQVLAWVVGLASMAVGLLGMVLHLRSGFFDEQTLHQLVYTAPFVAPLAYMGLGLLVLLNRMERVDTLVWAQWVVLLALGGFVGNFGLCLLDHAQNGFFSAFEWVGVVSAAFASSFLLLAMLRPERGFLRVCFGVMALQAVVGLLGAALHLSADAHAHSTSWHDRLVYGAPVFAPMLFADLAILGAIGLWALLRAMAVAPAATATTRA